MRAQVARFCTAFSFTGGGMIRLDPGADTELTSTERKVRLGFTFALACLAVIGVVSYLSVVRLKENAAWVEHTHEVLSSLELLLAAATDSETAERGYVITGDQSYLEPYRQAAAVVDGQTRRLRELTADNRAQQQRLDSVAALVNDRLANLRGVIELRQDQGFAAAQGEILTGKGKQFHDRIRRLIDQMKSTRLPCSRSVSNGRTAAPTSFKPVTIGGWGSRLRTRRTGAVRDPPGLCRPGRADRALRDAKDQLELRVRQRTAELREGGGDQCTAGIHHRILRRCDCQQESGGHHHQLEPGRRKAARLYRAGASASPMAMLSRRERRSEEPAILARIARGETTDQFETVRIAKDGRKIDVAVTISPIRDSQGRIIGASKIARDITTASSRRSRCRPNSRASTCSTKITRAIASGQDIQSIFQVVIRTLEEHLPVDFCCICLYDPARIA